MARVSDPAHRRRRWLNAGSPAVLVIAVLATSLLCFGRRGGAAAPFPVTAHPAALTSSQPTREPVDLKLVGISQGKAFKHLRYQQTLNGIPVEGAYVTDHIDKRSGAKLGRTDKSIKVPEGRAVAVQEPQLTADEAISAARKAAGIEKGRGEETADLSVPAGEQEAAAGLES